MAIQAEVLAAVAQGTSRQGGDRWHSYRRLGIPSASLPCTSPSLKTSPSGSRPSCPPCIALGALINVGVLWLIDASQKDDPTRASTFRQVCPATEDRDAVHNYAML